MAKILLTIFHFNYSCKDGIINVWWGLTYASVFGMDRSSRTKVYLGKRALKICSKSTGEHLFQSVTSKKLFCNFIAITLRHGCSSANLVHIFRITFPKHTSGWLPLDGTDIAQEEEVFLLAKECLFWDAWKTFLGKKYLWRTIARMLRQYHMVKKGTRPDFL